MSEPRVRLQLLVPESFKRRLKVAAAEHGLTMVEALERWWQPDPAEQQSEPRPSFDDLEAGRAHVLRDTGDCAPWCRACHLEHVARMEAEPDEPLPHERNTEIREEAAPRSSSDPLPQVFSIARSHEVDSSGLCVSWCSACRQSAEAERKADYDKAVRLANERKAIKEPGGRDTTEKIKRLRDGLATLRHSTREDGTCPHWCVRCDVEHQLRQLGEFE